MGPTPEKVTVIRAEGLKGRQKVGDDEVGTLEMVSNISDVVALTVQLLSWALANRPRKERANAVVRRNIVRPDYTYCPSATRFIYNCVNAV